MKKLTDEIAAMFLRTQEPWHGEDTKDILDIASNAPEAREFAKIVICRVVAALNNRDINATLNESSIGCVPVSVVAVLSNEEKQAAYQAQRDARRLILPALEIAEPAKRIALEKLHPLEELNKKPTAEESRIKKEDADQILREADESAEAVLKSYGIEVKP